VVREWVGGATYGGKGDAYRGRGGGVLL